MVQSFNLRIAHINSDEMYSHVYCRGIRIANPFFSLWSTKTGMMLGKAFIGIAIAAGVIYFIILLVFIIKAMYHIWQRRSSFAHMAKGLRVHYMVSAMEVCVSVTLMLFLCGVVYHVH